MLQWMGGSRRKVNTSRMSTQKRQKQYFEQRKRQQQTGELESHADVIDSVNHKNKHKSLDILSILNLSTVAQECKSTFPNGNSLEIDTSTESSQLTMSQPTIFSNSVYSVDSPKFKKTITAETGNIPVQQAVAISPKKDSLNAIDGLTNASNVIGGKLSHWKSSDQQLSVLDLLDEEEQDGNIDVRVKNEDHVAFSVQGLGTVETQTPVHSPRQSSRKYCYGCSSPLKRTKGLQPSKNFNFMHNDLDLEMDSMMQDMNKSHHRNSSELPSYRRSKRDSYNTVDDCIQFDDHSSKIRSSFSDRNIFYGIRDSKDNIWNDLPVRSSFPDDNFVDEMGHDRSWKNWPCQMDDGSGDIFNFGSNEMYEFPLEGSHSHKKRNTKKATKSFDILESFSPHHLEPDNFLISDAPRYSTARKKSSFRDVTNQQNMFHFATEDLRDCLSSLSEESCSSSAVRGDMKNSPSRNQSTRIHGNHVRGSNYVNNVSGPGIQTRISNVPRSKSSQVFNFNFDNDLNSNNNVLLEEEVSLGFGSFCQTPKTKFTSSDYKLWSEDPLTVSNTETNMKSSFQRSKKIDGFFGEKLVFLQPDLPTISTVVIGLTRPDLNQDFEEKEPKTSNSSQFSGSDGDSKRTVCAVITEYSEKSPKSHCNEGQIDSSETVNYGSKSNEAKTETLQPSSSTKIPVSESFNAATVENSCDDNEAENTLR